MARFSTNLVRLIAVGLASFHVYTGYFGTFYPYVQRSVPVMLALVLTFLTIRGGKRGDGDEKIPLHDWGLALLAIPVIGYVTYNSEYLANRWPMTPTFAMSDVEIACGVVASLLILEATRRVLGWLLVIVAAVSLLYTYYGEHIPILVLRHRPYTFEHMLDYLYMTDNGIWGVALGGRRDLHRVVHHLRRICGEGGRLAFLHRFRQRDRRSHQGRAGEGRDRVLGDDRFGHRVDGRQCLYHRPVHDPDDDAAGLSAERLPAPSKRWRPTEGRSCLRSWARPRSYSRPIAVCPI